MAGHFGTNRVHLDQDEIARRYLAGDSVLAIARDMGVTRRTIDIRLARAGVTKRSPGDQLRIENAKVSPERRKQRAAAAHEAKRGRPNPTEALERAARTREALGRFGSPEERELAGYLAALGEVAIPQRAIGTYSADLAVGHLAIEVFGGNWHGSGVHARRSPKRFDFFFDAGWNLAIIWTQVRNPITARTAEALRDFRLANLGQTGRYCVMTGDGTIITEASAPFRPEHLAAINRRPPTDRPSTSTHDATGASPTRATRP